MTPIIYIALLTNKADYGNCCVKISELSEMVTPSMPSKLLLKISSIFEFCHTICCLLRINIFLISLLLIMLYIYCISYLYFILPKHFNQI